MAEAWTIRCDPIDRIVDTLVAKALKYGINVLTVVRNDEGVVVRGLSKEDPEIVCMPKYVYDPLIAHLKALDAQDHDFRYADTEYHVQLRINGAADRYIVTII